MQLSHGALQLFTCTCSFDTKKRYPKKSENNEAAVSGIVPHGESYKEKAEAVNMLLKDTCTKENMHFRCMSQ